MPYSEVTVLRSILAEFTVSADDSPLRKLGERINSVTGALSALAATFAVDRLGAWVGELSEAADELGDTSERLGISTEALQAWGHAAELSGSSAEEFEGSISRLVRSVAEAGEGGEEAAAVFRKLGVSVKDSEGNLQSVEALLPEIADGIAGVENPTERAALAMQVFGRGAQGLVPLLSRGAAGVEALRTEFRELGGGFSDETIQQAGQFRDTLTRLGTVADTLRSRLLSSLLPAFQLFAETAIRTGQAIQYVAQNTKLIETALGVAGAATAAFTIQWVRANAVMLSAAVRTWVPIIARFALAGTAVLAVVAIVEDLITLFDGGESVVGEFIDSIFGLGTAEEVVMSLRQGFEDLVYWAARGAAALSGDFQGADLQTPEQQQARRRQESIEKGDLAGFLKDRLPGMSRERAREDFLAGRGDFVRSNPALATDEDKRVGLVPSEREVRAPRVTNERAVSAPRAQVSAKVDAPVVTINVQPGASGQQVEDTRRVVAQELDKHHRRTLAAFGGVAP